MPRRTCIRLTKHAIETARPGTYVWDNEVPGFGVRVTPRGARSFIFQYRTRCDEQGKITMASFPALTVEEARKRARELRTDVDKGGNPSKARRERREAADLRTLAAYYTDDYARQRPLKPRTVSDARRLLNRYALPRYGGRKVQDLTVSDVRNIVSDAREGSGRYEANRLRAVLSRMFTLARQNGWRADNPCGGVEKLPEDQRWVHLSDANVEAILTACDRYPDQNAADVIRLLLFTGARLQEVLRADWTQFDLGRGIWEKPSSHTKTRINHRVPLAAAVVELLTRMREQDRFGIFRFPGRTKDRPRVDLKRPWAAILKDAELVGFRRHDLRRTTASFMLSEGVALAAVGKTLGHTQPSTTARYAHLFEEVQREAIQKGVNRMLAGRLAIQGRSTRPSVLEPQPSP